MANSANMLQQLRAERREAQLHVDKLDQAISVIESLNGSGASRKASRPTRIISVASRRKMAQAQKARWARVGKGSQSAKAVTGSAPAKCTMSHQPAGRSRLLKGHGGLKLEQGKSDFQR
jgi:phage major head subunit gpT-like protein